MKSNVDFSTTGLYSLFSRRVVGYNSGLRRALVLFSVFCLKLINRAKPPPPPSPRATTDAVYSDCEFCRRLSSAVWSNSSQPGATEPRGEIFLLDSVYYSCEKYWVISCRLWNMSYNQLYPSVCLFVSGWTFKILFRSWFIQTEWRWWCWRYIK